MVVLFIFKEIKFVDNSFTNITFKYDSHFVEHFFFADGLNNEIHKIWWPKIMIKPQHCITLCNSFKDRSFLIKGNDENNPF